MNGAFEEGGLRALDKSPANLLLLLFVGLAAHAGCDVDSTGLDPIPPGSSADGAGAIADAAGPFLLDGSHIDAFAFSDGGPVEAAIALDLAGESQTLDLEIDRADLSLGFELSSPDQASPASASDSGLSVTVDASEREISANWDGGGPDIASSPDLSSSTAPPTVDLARTDAASLLPALDLKSASDLGFPAGDAVTDFGDDLSPDLSPELSPELSPDLSPELSPDLSPELSPDLSPDLNPDFAPDLGIDLSPDLSTNLTPDLGMVILRGDLRVFQYLDLSIRPDLGTIPADDLFVDAAADLSVPVAPDLKEEDLRSASDLSLRGGPDLAVPYVLRFEAPTPIASYGTAPVSADLNGDGALDLLIGSVYSLQVLFGDGKGGYAAPVTIAGQGSACAVGDVDGDGILDVIAASSSVLYLRGQGAGAYAAPVVLGMTSPTSSYSPQQPLRLVDFDGDGALDLVIAESKVATGIGTLALYRGHGDGTFSAGNRYSIDKQPLFVVDGDFNADGQSDLAIACLSDGSGAIDVLLNAGSGDFDPSAPAYAGFTPVTIAVADLDGDGALDLVAGSDQLYVLWGNGDGSFVSGAALPSSSTNGVNSGQWAVVGDWNGDGKIDIAAGFAGSVTLHLAAGVRAFSSPRRFTLDRVPGGGGDQVLVAGDLNGDGFDDITSAQGPVIVALSKGDGTLAAPEEPLVSNQSVALGDIDGDGRLDVATGGYSGPTVVMLQVPGAGFVQTATFSDSTPTLTLGDFDGDGHLDLATWDYDLADVLIRLGDGKGGFGAPKALGQSTGRDYLGAIDLDADGRVDLVGTTTDQWVTIFPGNGDGTFATVEYAYVGVDSGAVTAGDLDGDGKLDLVVTSSNPPTMQPVGLATLRGLGAFQFAAATPYRLGNIHGAALLGDLDSDGKLDVIVTAGTACNAYHGKGDTTLTGPTSISGECAMAGLADFNRDGLLDLVEAGSSTGLHVLTGDGKGTFKTALAYSLGGPFVTAQIGVADFDGDGWPDVELQFGALTFLRNITPY